MNITAQSSVVAHAVTATRRGWLAPALLAAAVWLAAVGCAHVEYIPGTTVLKTDENKEVIDFIEKYRQRLISRRVDELLVLASEKYFEDSGTPRSDDDYGYQGLREVLTKKLQRVKSLRYDLEYRSVKVTGSRAEVEVFIDGSFELAAESGDRYRRVNDYHKFVLEKDKSTEHWKFLSGM